MCKYASSCQLCGYAINLKTEYQNMQDVVIDISSECPNLDFISGKPILVDAMHELIVPKENSTFAGILDAASHSKDCTVYDSVIDAIGKSLGRYYEIA